MTKILLIEPDPARAAVLAAALAEEGGVEVRTAPDGFYALTLMERELPDLVVVAGTWLGGIGVGELGAIVRSDPALAGVRLALCASPAASPADLNGGGAFDLVLDAAAATAELAARLRGLAGLPSGGAPMAEAVAPSPQAPAAPVAEAVAPSRQAPAALVTTAAAPVTEAVVSPPRAPAAPVVTAAAPWRPAVPSVPVSTAGAAARATAGTAAQGRPPGRANSPFHATPSGFATAEMPGPWSSAKADPSAAPMPPVLPAPAAAHSRAAPRPAPTPGRMREAPSAAVPETPPRRSPDLSGSLGVLDLMELSQAFSLASKTGQLFLDCPRGEGCVTFELGKVIHATIRDRAGREAFAEILQATLRERNIAFRFAPREQGELAAVPRTIDLTVQHLLLSLAVDFDETQDS